MSRGEQSSNASLVLTVIGPDRPGLVESISDAVARHGGNWLGSHMARLAGQFAGILHVHVPAASVEALAAALRELESRGLTAVVHRSDDAPTPPGHSAIVLELVGQDHPGIVRDISHAIARHHVNVVELESACEPAPMSGEMLFKARIVLQAPPGASLDALRTELEELAHDLVVDIKLDDA